jgi:hypothetical protein
MATVAVELARSHGHHHHRIGPRAGGARPGPPGSASRRRARDSESGPGSESDELRDHPAAASWYQPVTVLVRGRGARAPAADTVAYIHPYIHTHTYIHT